MTFKVTSHKRPTSTRAFKVVKSNRAGPYYGGPQYFDGATVKARRDLHAGENGVTRHEPIPRFRVAKGDEASAGIHVFASRATAALYRKSMLDPLYYRVVLLQVNPADFVQSGRLRRYVGGKLGYVTLRVRMYRKVKVIREV